MLAKNYLSLGLYFCIDWLEDLTCKVFIQSMWLLRVNARTKNNTEADLTSEILNEYVYPQKIMSAEYQLMDEMRKAWPSIDKVWLKLVNQEGLPPIHLKLAKYLLHHYAVLYILLHNLSKS